MKQGSPKYHQNQKEHPSLGMGLGLGLGLGLGEGFGIWKRTDLPPLVAAILCYCGLVRDVECIDVHAHTKFVGMLEVHRVSIAIIWPLDQGVVGQRSNLVAIYHS